MALYDDPKKLYLREKLSCRAKVGGKVFTFDVRIQDIDTKGILTGVPDLGGPSIDVGQEILVRYYRQDSAYQFLTRVLGFEDRTGPVLRIGFPSRITRYQRRTHTRAELGGTVRFMPTGQLTEQARGFVKDVSAGGVQFSTRQVGMFNSGLPAVGTSITMDFVLPGDNEFVGIVGFIRRVTSDQERPGFVRVQVEFTKISQRAADRLELISRKFARGI